MFKVDFSLLSNIDWSACSTLDSVLNSQSDCDELTKCCIYIIGNHQYVRRFQCWHALFNVHQAQVLIIFKTPGKSNCWSWSHPLYNKQIPKQSYISLNEVKKYAQATWLLTHPWIYMCNGNFFQKTNWSHPYTPSMDKILETFYPLNKLITSGDLVQL